MIGIKKHKLKFIWKNKCITYQESLGNKVFYRTQKYDWENTLQ